MTRWRRRSLRPKIHSLLRCYSAHNVLPLSRGEFWKIQDAVELRRLRAYWERDLSA